MSYTKLLYHAVFCTKCRKNTIPEQHEKELYAYIMGIISNKKSKLYRIGGTENHLHLLFDMHPTFALSDFMREVKKHSSKWLGQNPNFSNFEGWAVSFAEEYRQFLTDNGVEIDEKYFLKD